MILCVLGCSVVVGRAVVRLAIENSDLRQAVLAVKNIDQLDLSGTTVFDDRTIMRISRESQGEETTNASRALLVLRSDCDGCMRAVDLWSQAIGQLPKGSIGEFWVGIMDGTPAPESLLRTLQERGIAFRVTVIDDVRRFRIRTGLQWVPTLFGVNPRLHSSCLVQGQPSRLTADACLATLRGSGTRRHYEALDPSSFTPLALPPVRRQ
jgi:hypothetical protein